MDNKIISKTPALAPALAAELTDVEVMARMMHYARSCDMAKWDRISDYSKYYCRRAAADCLRALTANGRAKIVRREPTSDMLDDVTAADQHEPFSDKTMKSVFQAMFDAAKPYSGE